jgi:hypothetical protein
MGVNKMRQHARASLGLETLAQPRRQKDVTFVPARHPTACSQTTRQVNGCPQGACFHPSPEEILMRKVVFWTVAMLGFGFGSAWAAEPPAGHSMGGHAMEGHAMDNKGMQQESCGQMVSGMSGLPAKMAEGNTSVADVVDAHAALLGKDKESAAEAKGMRALAKTYRQVASDLNKASDEMKKAASWPAAPHDMAKMQSDPKLTAATKKMIDVHKEIIAMLQKNVADMEQRQKQAGAK